MTGPSKGGRLAVVFILLLAVLGGAGVWYANERAYYEEVALPELRLERADGSTATLALADARAIDATSSPLRFRACVSLEAEAIARLQAEAPAFTGATPLTGPGWFDCYDADAIGADLAAGRAQGILLAAEFAEGVDRVGALYPDGTAFLWHQLNARFE